MLSSNRQFRMMGISDILDETVDLYRSSFVLLIGIAALVYVPCFLISTLLPQPPQIQDTSQLPLLVTSQIPQFILLALMAVLFEPLVTGALTYAISERYLNKETSIKECFARVLRWRVFRSLIGATVIRYLFTLLPVVFMSALAAFAMLAAISGAQSGMTGLAIALVLLVLGALMLLPMIYFALRFMVVAPAVVVEERGVIGALQRSWTLMRGSLFKAFGLMLVALIIVLLITAIITGPTTAVKFYNAQQGKETSTFVNILDTTLSAVLNTVTVPVLSIIPILFYYDLRIRKEGFDLEMLAEELGRKAREVSDPAKVSLSQERLAPSPNHLE